MYIKENVMKVSGTLKVFAVICMVIACVSCNLNIDKVTPPSWIQGTWEGTDHVFTFTKNDIIHTIKGSAGGFTATGEEITMVDVTYSESTYQVELKKNGVTEAHKFELFSYAPDQIEYYHANSAGVFPSSATDTLDREH